LNVDSGILVIIILTDFWWSGWAPAASSFSTISGWLWEDADIRAVHPSCGRRGKDNRWSTGGLCNMQFLDNHKYFGYLKGANEVNREYFQQAVLLCLLRVLY